MMILLSLLCSTANAAPVRPPVRYAAARPFRTVIDCTRDRLHAWAFHQRNAARAVIGLPALRPR